MHAPLRYVSPLLTKNPSYVAGKGGFENGQKAELISGRPLVSEIKLI